MEKNIQKEMQNNKLTPDQMYNNSTIRNVTVVFGSVFSNIHVRKYLPDGSIDPVNTSLVPIAYSAKTQYGYWIEQQMRKPTGNIEINMKLPRLSFELNGLSLANDRGINTNLPLVAKKISQDGTQLKSRAPISYSFDFTLSIWAKQMDDSIQVLDQILPFFTPELSIKTKESKIMNIVNDIKIVLNSISKNDNYAEGFNENRIIEWDLSFTVFANIIPKYETTHVIQSVIIDTVETVVNDYENGIIPDYMNIHGKYGVKVYETPERTS